VLVGLPHSEEELSEIYDKTDGYCFYCGKKLAFTNYGRHGEKGSWHVEHKNPKARGGSDYFRNLVPACIDCNLDKKDRPVRSYKGDYEPATWGAKIVKFFGLPEGSLGASRRKRRIR